MFYLCKVNNAFERTNEKTLQQKVLRCEQRQDIREKKVAYQEELEKSCADIAACSRTSYKKDLQKSRADTATCSKANYKKTLEKSRADSAARSKAN